MHKYANIKTNADSTAVTPLSTASLFNVYYFIIEKKGVSMTAVDEAALCS